MSQPLTEKPNAEQVSLSASAAVVIDGRYLPPPQDKDGKIWARTSAIVQASADPTLWSLEGMSRTLPSGKREYRL